MLFYETIKIYILFLILVFCKKRKSFVLINNMFVFLSTFRFSPIAKRTESAPLPNVEEENIVKRSLTHNRVYTVIALAVHDPEKNILYAILAPTTAKDDLQGKWKVEGLRLSHPLKNGQKIFICIPLGNDTEHLPLENYTLW